MVGKIDAWYKTQRHDRTVQGANARAPAKRAQTRTCSTVPSPSSARWRLGRRPRPGACCPDPAAAAAAGTASVLSMAAAVGQRRGANRTCTCGGEYKSFRLGLHNVHDTRTSPWDEYSQGVSSERNFVVTVRLAGRPHLLLGQDVRDRPAARAHCRLLDGRLQLAGFDLRLAFPLAAAEPAALRRCRLRHACHCSSLCGRG